MRVRLPYYFLISFAFIAFGCNCFSQENPIFKTGDPFALLSGKFSGLMDSDGDSVYSLQLDHEGYLGFGEESGCAIMIFDRSLNLIRKLNLNCPIDLKLKKPEPVSFFKTSVGYILLCRSWSVQNLTINSYLIQIDSTGVVNEVLNPGTIGDIAKSDADFDFFGLHKIQNDSLTQFVFTIKTPPFREVSERIIFNIYNQDLILQGNRLLDFPNDFMDYDIKEVIGNGEGLFFIRVESSNPYKMGDVVQQLVVYDIYSDNFETYTLNFEGFAIQKAALFDIEKNKIGLCGYFSNDRFDMEPSGIFYYLLDAETGELLVEKIQKFSADEIVRLKTENLSSNSSFENLIPSAMHITGHNHVCLLFEYKWKKIMLIRDHKGMLYDRTYFYANEILLFQFDANNEFLHSAIIPKKQALGIDREILGFYSFPSSGSLFVLYNDNPKNRHKNDGAKLKTMKGKHEMIMVDYDLLSGTFSKTVATDLKHPLRFSPAKVFPEGDTSVLFFDQSEKYRLLEILIK